VEGEFACGSSRAGQGFGLAQGSNLHYEGDGAMHEGIHVDSGDLMSDFGKTIGLDQLQIDSVSRSLSVSFVSF
jgi:hypothetical protein